MLLIRSLSLGFHFLWGTIDRSADLLETLKSYDFWLDVWCGDTTDDMCGCERCYVDHYPSSEPDRLTWNELLALSDTLKVRGVRNDVIARAMWAGMLPYERDTAIRVTQDRIMSRCPHETGTCSDATCDHNLDSFEQDMLRADYRVVRDLP